MINRCVAYFAALFLCAITNSPVLAEDVTLQSRDGSVEISGNIISFDGELYRVDTAHGVLTIDASGVVCEGPGCPDLGAFVADVSFSGSRTMGAVLMPALVQAFAFRKGYKLVREIKDDDHFTITLSDGETDQLLARFGFRIASTAEGFADLIAGEADIVMSMRLPTDEEIRLARDAGAGNLNSARRSRIVGLDAMVAQVASGNPITAISPNELADIFAGNIVSWVELGGDDIPIRLHLRDSLSGLYSEFERRLMPHAPKVADSVTFHESNASLSDAVARDVSAIGIGALSDTGNARAIQLSGPCGKTRAANDISLKTQDYPLTTPLFLFTPGYRLPWVGREFLGFVRSAAGQQVVSRAGFVDLRLSESPVSAQGQRLANAIANAGEEIDLTELQRLVTTLDGTEKLSLSFRFEPGSTRLDAQSRSNTEILAARLESGLLDHRKVTFVGFSDGDGAAAGNLRLARRRAEVVRRAVLSAAPAAEKNRLDLNVDAFGEAMPIACDDVEWGREINRRVEVWVAQR